VEEKPREKSVNVQPHRHFPFLFSFVLKNHFLQHCTEAMAPIELVQNCPVPVLPAVESKRPKSTQVSVKKPRPRETPGPWRPCQLRRGTAPRDERAPVGAEGCHTPRPPAPNRASTPPAPYSPEPRLTTHSCGSEATRAHLLPARAPAVHTPVAGYLQQATQGAEARAALRVQCWGPVHQGSGRS